MRRSGLHIRQFAAFKRSILIAALLITSCLVCSAATDVKFKTWNTENGLPQNSVTGIAQTPDGYIWLATFDGLARFDGVRFKVFRKLDTPELPTNRLAGLFVDKAGRLWILTEDTTHVVVYEQGRFKSFTKGKDFETTDMTEPWQLSHEMVLRNGDVEYVYENGAFSSRPTSRQNLPPVFVDETLAVWIDMGDHYLTGVEGNLARVEKTATLPEKLKVQPSVRIGDTLWFLLPYYGQYPKDPYGRVAPPGGLTHLARIHDGEVTSFPVERPDGSFLNIDRNGSLWLGDVSYGLFRIDASTLAGGNTRNFPIQKVSNADLHIRDIFKDREGNVWLCTDTGLRLLRDSPAIRVYSSADGLPDENAYSVFEDDRGSIWFGAWPSSLIRYDSETFYPERFELVSALLTDRNSRQWVGNSLLWYRDTGTEWHRFDVSSVQIPQSEIDVIQEDTDGNIWFGGPKDNISKWDGRAVRQFTMADGLPSDSVTSFLQTRDGTIWIGTIAGIARFDGARFVPVTSLNGPESGYVRYLYEDNDGALWIGTYDSGLFRFKDGKFVQITTENGLFSNGVFCILEDDDGWFWMNSNQGIYRARRSDLNDFADGIAPSIVSASYGPEDGLANVEGNGGKQPAGLKASDGRLWFPTAGGMAVVNPKTIHRDERAPDVLIEEIKVDQNEIPPVTDRLVIQPGETAVEINYTGISFSNAPTLRFRYRLEGLEETWTEVGSRRTAYFSHLPYGEFTFRVLAGNRDGVWNEQGASLVVTIERPFYRTYWFYALISLLVAGAIGFMYYSRVSHLRRVAEARELYARELLESQERERSRLAMELHDSLGQSLVVIRNRALLGISKQGNDGVMLDQLQEISDASAAALQETRNIAHTLHPYQIEALGLSTALHSLIDKFENSSEIIFAVDIDKQVDNVSHDVAMAIYRIAQEWLTNIVKHASAEHVEVSLDLDGSKLMLRVTDDGIGFDPHGVNKGLGLKGIEERARMTHASMDIASSPGAGSSLTLTVNVD